MKAFLAENAFKNPLIKMDENIKGIFYKKIPLIILFKNLERIIEGIFSLKYF